MVFTSPELNTMFGSRLHGRNLKLFVKLNVANGTPVHWMNILLFRKWAQIVD